MSTPGPIEGKYEVIAKIREGGMGAVYMVRHRLLNELRVIKVMRPEVAESEDQRKRFLREAQTATRLKHSNIVSFYDFFVDGESTAYMVMEYIEGINLRDMLRNCGPLPVTLGVFLARQCLSALDYLHRKGIVHRDIAPDNVMMTQEEDGTLQAKLIDLGIAKIAQATEELTAADEFIGKLRYSSPEQLTKSASSRQIDGRSDIFSFGVVLYEVLTGVCPYGGGSLQEILSNRLHKPPLSFADSDPDRLVPEGLRAIILRALQSKPADRWQAAGEFGKAVEALAPAEGPREEPAAVKEYVRKAVELARRAAPATPGVASLQHTLQSKFRASEVSAQPVEATDLEYQKTIRDPSAQGMRADAAKRPSGGEGTLAYAGPSAARPPSAAVPVPARRGLPAPVTYGLVAVGGALLVALGVWVAGQGGRADRAGTSENPTAGGQAEILPATAPPVGAVSLEPTAPPPIVLIAEAIPTPPPPEPTSAPPAERPRPVSRGGVPTPESRVVRDSRPARDDGPRGGGGPAVEPAREKTRFCAEIKPASYTQGVEKGAAPGFENTPTHRQPFPQVGRIHIRITLDPPEPFEGQSFLIIARFVNESDFDFRFEGADESAPRARGGYLPLSVSVPVIRSGGTLEIYRARISLGAGDTYPKAFRVRHENGDYWEASVFVSPCIEESS